MEKVPWDVLERIAREHMVIGMLVAVTEDIVDYFTDLAKATDDQEMGGFLLGDFIEPSKGPTVYLVRFYDYIQVPNMASDPTRHFRFSRESLYEVFDMIESGRYDCFTTLHTHPSDSFFSPGDLHAKYKFNRIFQEIMSSRLPESIIRAVCFVPAFLVTGGTVGYVLTWTEFPHSVCYYVKGKYVVADSMCSSLSPSRYIREILPSRARIEEPLDKDFHKYVDEFFYSIIEIPELEKLMRE